jgi:hypothetical protein
MQSRAVALVVLTPARRRADGGDAAEPVNVVDHLNEGLEQAASTSRSRRRTRRAAHRSRPTSTSSRSAASRSASAASPSRRRNIEPSKVVPDAKIVASGVAEVARLQSLEHYSYLKP